MSQTMNPFQPMGSATNTNHGQATTSSASFAISPAPAASDQIGRNVRISASAACFVALGTSAIAITIAAAGTPGNGIYLGAGQSIIMPIGPTDTHVGTRTSTGTAEVYATRGDGG
jgi:hypothetical protein